MGVMSLAEIMDMSVEILRKYVKTIVMFNLGFGVVFLIALFVFVIAASILIAITGVITSSPIFVGIMIGIVVVFIFSFYLSSNIGLIKITCQEPFEARIYASDAIKASFKGFFKVLGIALLALMIFSPVIGIFGGIAYGLYPLISSIINATNPNLALKIFNIVLLALISLIPLFIIYAYLTFISFSLQAATIEKKGVLSSLKRSFGLVKNSFWKIFGSLLLIYAAVTAINYSIQGFVVLIATGIYYGLKLLNMSIEFSSFITKVNLYSGWPLAIIQFLFIAPLSTIMITMMYFNERFKAEGIDILLRLRRLKKNEERKQAIEGTVSGRHN